MKLLKLIEQLREAYKNAYGKIKAELERHQAAEKKHNENKKVYSAKAIRDEYDNMRKEHADNINAIAREVKDLVARVRADYEKEALIEYQPQGTALNMDDVALLNSGIVLNADEVELMAKKYADNSTMLRVIESYVKKNGVKINTETHHMFSQAGRMFEVAMRAFDFFVNKAGRTLELMLYNDPKNEIFAKCNVKIEQYLEEYKNEMQTGTAVSEV